MREKSLNKCEYVDSVLLYLQEYPAGRRKMSLCLQAWGSWWGPRCCCDWTSRCSRCWNRLRYRCRQCWAAAPLVVRCLYAAPLYPSSFQLVRLVPISGLRKKIVNEKVYIKYNKVCLHSNKILYSVTKCTRLPDAFDTLQILICLLLTP